MKKLTIYDIKELTAETAPYFFKRDTMKFFGQTLKDYRVHMFPPYYRISAPMRDHSGKIVGQTVRYFDPFTKELLRYINK